MANLKYNFEFDLKLKKKKKTGKYLLKNENIKNNNKKGKKN